MSAGGERDDAPSRRAVERALTRIEARGAEIRAAELDRALTRLEARGELTEEQRAAVETLSERLVERLLSVPRESLRAAAHRGDDERAGTALELFGDDS